MKYIILDTETTGIEKDDRIIQLAYIVLEDKNKEIFQTFCKPQKEINFQAMAIHHITPEMIENSTQLIDTEEYKYLQKINKPENFIIIQNAKFDLDMLEKEGFENKMKVIDTLILAKHLFPNFERHSEQFLRYKLGLYKSEHKILDDFGIKEIAAHDAIGDILVLKLLFDYLKNIDNIANEYKKIKNLTNVFDQNRLLLDDFLKDYPIDNQFYILSQIPVLIDEFRFGKHRGKLVQEVVRTDRAYINWMINKMDNLDDDLLYTLNFYLGKKQQIVIEIPEKINAETKGKETIIIPEKVDTTYEDDPDVIQPSIFDDL
ncbi:MAG: 3'-5' exonuclease [Candidatus Cloacimonadota bacterium]|nr:3'-5' exonuclease [Candidatus Cloacimonadota bacterium]